MMCLCCLLQWLCIPFSLTNEAVGSLSLADCDWIGTVEPAAIGQYMDYGLLLVLGGIPWQVREYDSTLNWV